jgi:type IV pilus assembly protein PilQ
MKRYKAVAGIALILSLCNSLLFAGQGYIESLKFKDMDIRLVLDAISQEAHKEGENINIIVTPEVEGLVSIDLKNIDWRTALAVILKTYNYSYTQRGDVITVSAAQAQATRAGLKMELFKFKYLYADVAKNFITPFLSAEGKVSVLEVTEDKISDPVGASSSVNASMNNTYGTTSSAPAMNTLSGTGSSSTPSHSKILVVYDTQDRLDQISTTLSELDVMPKQVLIQAIIMEVNRDTLRDIGFEWGTGANGATGTPSSVPSGSNTTIAGRNIAFGGNSITPSVFNPVEGTANFPGTYPYQAGLQVLFQQLAGSKLQVLVHALEEDVRTNTLSKPIILAANNQLASILVGTQFPIIQTSSSTQSSYIVGGSLQQYLNIGIQLQVKPQICGANDEYINLLVHPIVSSYSKTVDVKSGSGNSAVTLVSYPIVDTREAVTQMLLKDGESIVMGGLLKNVKSNEDLGIPFLSKIPWLGNLFKRHTKDNSKVDLMIFITAKIVKPGEVLPEEVLNTRNVQEQFSGQNDKKQDKAKRRKK